MKFKKKIFFIITLVVLTFTFFMSSKNVEATPYAVLINGGHNIYNNNVAFWNDLSSIYTTLISDYGYSKSNIYVLNSDGTNPANDRNRVTDFSTSPWTYSYDNSPLDLDGDGNDDIHYAATTTALTTVFNNLASTMTSDDGLFVFATDHGGSDGGTETNLSMWNSSVVDDDVFASLVNLISDYAYEIFSFQQCFSGGFIDELSDNKRVIMTAADYDEFSWYWVNGYGEYDHELTNALSGLGDANGDGYVSMLETYNYILANDYFATIGVDTNNDGVPDAWEHPQYDDPSGIGRYLTLTGVIPEPSVIILLSSLAAGLFSAAGLKRHSHRE